MKITYVKTIGFRKFEQEFEAKLYDITTITGGNTQGKTNILYAIIWAFLGSNLTGDEKVWLGNKKSDNCYVELKFIDNNGKEHKLARYKNKYDNKKNFIMLDDKKTEPEKLTNFYYDKKLFLSVLNPSYFINKKPAEQKQLLDKYLPEIDMKTVYNKLEVNEQKQLEGIPKNIMDYIKDLNNNKKMYEDNIKSIHGKIEYAEQVANEKLEESKVFEKEEELILARQELSFLTADFKKVDREKQQKIVDNLLYQISELEKRIKDLTVEMVTGKKIYLDMKNQPVSYCPMCEQEIKDEHKQKTIANMKKDLEEVFAKRTTFEQNVSDLKGKLAIEKCKLYSLDNAPNLETKNEIDNVQKQIQDLEQERLEIQRHNDSITLKQKSIDSAKKDINEFRKQILKYDELIDNVKQTKGIAEKLFINYIEEKMKSATKYLKNVKIKYYSVLKDSGEIKEDFIITYNNNELKNLSRSETIATSLELCNMFNKISNINLPLFIDDSESCADYHFVEDYSKDTQILIARVEKGQELVLQEGYIENTYLQAA